MISSDQVEQLRTLIDQAQSIFVIFGENATVDHVAVAIALQQALQVAGKDVLLISPSRPINPQLQSLVGIDQVVTEIGNQNLSVSFPYDESAVDKVSYHIGEETHRFYLTIKPKKGAKPLDTHQVQFSYTGAETDLLFLIGVSQLSSLKDVYVGYEEIYESKPLVTVNSFSPDFGTVHLDTSGTPSMSEAIVSLIQSLGYSMTVDVATNLLTAIESLTKGFQSLSTTAETFETVARLLRMGARRVRQPAIVQPEPAGTTISTNTKPEEIALAPEQKHNGKQKKKPVGAPQNQPVNQPGSLNYQPTEGGVRT